MIIPRKLFLKTLFMFNLLMLNGALHQDSEKLTVHYMSNYKAMYTIMLTLKDEENLLVVTYESFGANLYLNLTLKNGFKPKIKVAKLFIDGNNDKEYIESSNNYFEPYMEKWDKLLIKANGSDLCFNIICVDEKTNVEQQYLFKVSATNLRKFVDGSAIFS